MNDKLDRLLSHLETFLPKTLSEEQWQSTTAFRWRRRDSIFGSIGFLQPVKYVADITFEDLQNIDRQIHRQFVAMLCNRDGTCHTGLQFNLRTFEFERLEIFLSFFERDGS